MDVSKHETVSCFVSHYASMIPYLFILRQRVLRLMPMRIHRFLFITGRLIEYRPVNIGKSCLQLNTFRHILQPVLQVPWDACGIINSLSEMVRIIAYSCVLVKGSAFLYRGLRKAF